MKNDYFLPRIMIITLIVMLGVGCEKNPVEPTPSGIVGLVSQSADDALNIVTWVVDGTVGDPRISWITWELSSGESIVWSGSTITYSGVPTDVGVYYSDVNSNSKIDVGDTFCVKAPGDGDYTLRWYIGEGYGEYMADY